MSGKQKILIVDDDMHIAELVSLYVEKEGFETKEVHDGREAIQMVSAFQPDLILLDLMLPGMDGYQVCAEIRKTSRVPVIMLTAKGETFDKVLGLELGADDYIVKPFDPKELVARVKAVLRRYEPQQEEGDILRFPNLEINISNYSVTYHGRGLEFPPKEFELLFYLAKHPNRVFTREQLLDQIWGYEYVGDTRTVDVHVKRIREKLNQEDEWGIRTVWSVGYKFGQKQKRAAEVFLRLFVYLFFCFPAFGQSFRGLVFQSHSGCLRFPPFCFHLVHAFLSEICNPQHDAERVKEKQQVVKAVHIVPRRAEQYHYAQHHHDDVCGGGFFSGGTLAVLLVCIHIVCRAESPAPFSVQALSRLRGQDSP